MPNYPVYTFFSETALRAFARLQERVGDAFVRGELTLDQWKAARAGMNRAIDRRLTILRDAFWPLEPAGVQPVKFSA